MCLFAQRILIVFCVFLPLFTLNVSAFDDPISLLGRIRWNYTAYEENLWTRSYENTTLEEIFNDHNRFIEAISKVFDADDAFYPIFNGSTSFGSIKNAVVVDEFLTNPYHVPVLNNVVLLNAQVLDYWSKFSNVTSYNVSNMLDVLMDDAIPALQTALSTFWNSSTTLVYFNFLQNVSVFNAHLAICLKLKEFCVSSIWIFFLLSRRNQKTAMIWTKSNCLFTNLPKNISQIQWSFS